MSCTYSYNPDMTGLAGSEVSKHENSVLLLLLSGTGTYLIIKLLVAYVNKAERTS